MTAAPFDAVDWLKDDGMTTNFVTEIEKIGIESVRLFLAQVLSFVLYLETIYFGAREPRLTKVRQLWLTCRSRPGWS